MNSNRRLTQNFRPQTSHSSRPSSASAAALNHHFADRLAINLSGNLGCPYDVRRDSVLPTILRSHHAVQSCKLHKTVDCFIIKGDTFDTEQLFSRIGISDEIWLNVSLEIVSEEEIGSLVNYSFPNTGNTRYFYYYYSDQQKNLPNDPNMVMKDISHDIPDITATHIISSIKLGIYVFVALELPSGDHQILDQLLDRIEKEMVDKKLHLSNEEIVLLNKITISKVFSNITDLKKVEDLYSICRKTIEMKQHHTNIVHYTTPFVQSTEPETVKFIKQHVLLLSKVKHTLETQLKKQNNNIIQKHIANIEEMYSDTIKQISQLILNIRCGKMEQQSIVVTLQEKTNDTMKQIHFLIEKLQLIQELKNENIEYLNMEKYDISALDDLKTILLKVLEKNNSYLVFCSTDEFKQTYISVAQVL
ncbi:hypothetical protein I4U23_020122 [Adineta vaga]|nr:hypothetical protein I4U23_020122 [Adineta vaga]